MNNIAEGYGRRSDQALKNFLMIAKGSVAEVESMLFLGEELGYISSPVQQELIKQTEETGKLISAFINKLKQTTK